MSETCQVTRASKSESEISAREEVKIERKRDEGWPRLHVPSSVRDKLKDWRSGDEEKSRERKRERESKVNAGINMHTLKDEG